MVISDGIPSVPRNRKPRNSVPNPSAEEKTTRNSVPQNKNSSKLSEFLSEPFRRKYFSDLTNQVDEMESLERKSVKELRTLFQPNTRNVQVHSATLVVLMN
jgi:hypothetical protein